MKKVVTLFFIFVFCLSFEQAQGQEISRKAMVDSIKAIDSEVQKYFPRWKICETDLQIQIYKTFQLLGYPEKDLDMTQIEVLAIPKTVDNQLDPYEILLISCGRAFMNTSELEANLGVLLDYLTGSMSYLYDYAPDFPRRDYCFVDIPPNVPVTENQAAAIMDYLEPSNVMHAFSISLFEQSLKVGESGFWLKSIFGNDEIGYHYWSSGEAKLLLKRPLYVNPDAKTSSKIPNLINAYLGGGYRITSGLANQDGVFEFLPDRVLNGSPNGKIIAGFDFHLPMHPQGGVHFNYEPQINYQSEMATEIKNFGQYTVPEIDGLPVVTPTRDGIHSEDELKGIVPILQSTGQITLFYNWWLDDYNPENYFRFDLGLSYSEVQEFAYFQVYDNDPLGRKVGHYLTTRDIDGLTLYKPNEFADWIYFKAEFRSQAAYPFGMSVQFSNQILLGRLYLPLVTPWLYLEAKYATPLRDARPYEIDNFFMISPVLRITI
ncbi:MAG: hypothetical protein V1779_04205 [bacterium]